MQVVMIFEISEKDAEVVRTTTVDSCDAKSIVEDLWTRLQNSISKNPNFEIPNFEKQLRDLQIQMTLHREQVAGVTNNMSLTIQELIRLRRQLRTM